MNENTFYFCLVKNEIDLGRRIKISFVTFLFLLVSINPGAKENSFVLVDKLIPYNVRLTNNISYGNDFEGVEKIVNAGQKEREGDFSNSVIVASAERESHQVWSNISKQTSRKFDESCEIYFFACKGF